MVTIIIECVGKNLLASFYENLLDVRQEYHSELSILYGDIAHHVGMRSKKTKFFV